jgi:toxin ParE1/3/4
MSQTEFSVILSPLAKRDFEDIQIYTLEKWGEAQRKKYAALIYDGLKKLSISPEFGHRRPDISPEHRVYRIGSHFAVYQIVGCEVRVSRLLHERMDFRRHIEP